MKNAVTAIADKCADGIEPGLFAEQPRSAVVLGSGDDDRIGIGALPEGVALGDGQSQVAALKAAGRSAGG